MIFVINLIKGKIGNNKIYEGYDINYLLFYIMFILININVKNVLRFF